MSSRDLTMASEERVPNMKVDIAPKKLEIICFRNQEAVTVELVNLPPDIVQRNNGAL